jgi:hypothetical protein
MREISLANPLWGAPRVHGELLKLGIAVAESTVCKYIRKGRARNPPGQSWKTFLHNEAAGIASIDLFVVPAVTFKLLYGFIVLGHDRRCLVSFGVTRPPTADWPARQISEAFPWDEAPRHLIRDRDSSYGEAFKWRVRAMGIRDHPIAAGCPWQNGYVERLIDPVRVPRSRDHRQCRSPASRDGRVRALLQSCSHTPGTAQGRSLRPVRSECREDHILALSRRAAALLRPNLIFDRDSGARNEHRRSQTVGSNGMVGRRGLIDILPWC